MERVAGGRGPDGRCRSEGPEGQVNLADEACRRAVQRGLR